MTIRDRRRGILRNCVGLSGVSVEDGVAGRQGGEEENLDGPSSHDQPPEPIHCPVLRLRHMECTCQFCVVECVIAVCLMCVSIVYMCIRVLQVSLCEYSNKLFHPSYYPPSRSHSPSPPSHSSHTPSLLRMTSGCLWSLWQHVWTGYKRD